MEIPTTNFAPVPTIKLPFNKVNSYMQCNTSEMGQVKFSPHTVVKYICKLLAACRIGIRDQSSAKFIPTKGAWEQNY